MSLLLIANSHEGRLEEKKAKKAEKIKTVPVMEDTQSYIRPMDMDTFMTVWYASLVTG